VGSRTSSFRKYRFQNRFAAGRVEESKKQYIKIDEYTKLPSGRAHLVLEKCNEADSNEGEEHERGVKGTYQAVIDEEG